MWTVHKAEDCKLPDNKNEEHKGKEDNTKNNWQLANVEWLLRQWLIKLVSGMITSYWLDNKTIVHG